MTKERREEVLLIALVCSVAAHVGLMFAVRSHVMTHPTVSARTEKTAPMRVTRAAPRPDPVKIEEILDLKALKDAPAAVSDPSAPRVAAPSAPTAATDVPAPEPEKMAAPAAPQTTFEVKPVGQVAVVPTAVPLTRIEAPQATASAAAPTFSVAVPKVSEPSASLPTGADRLPAPAFPTLDFRRETEGEDGPFEPAKEVYDRVDAAVVAAEKVAVRELVNASAAENLVKFVNLTMTSATDGAWRYFKVMMTPRTDLPVVPKDVVVLIDGSGSIGNDRLGSCRAAARRILRSCTNTGDRFNLVVFRNAFSYAFRTWRDCDAASFAAGDKWLSAQTAHGRTDVFSTIRSVLTLPRDPKRPLVALVVTDGDANMGVSDTAEILSKFTALNDGLVSVYMYGVKSSANRELIDVLTHGNRGESFIFDGWRWNAGSEMEGLSERFRDPVLSDLRVVFAANSAAEAYPRLLRNLYRGGTLEFVGRVPASATDVAFSLKGLNGADAYEGFFRLPFATAASDPALPSLFASEAAIDRKLGGK